VISYSGPSSQTNTAANTTTSWLTFNPSWTNTLTLQPGLAPGSAPQPLTFTVSARNPKTGASQTQVVTILVVPPPDTLTALVTYITGAVTGGTGGGGGGVGGGGGKASKMQVTVATTAPLTVDPNTLAVLNPTFRLSFVVSDPNDPRFGQTVVWDSWAFILGVPTATILGFPMPDSITVTSSAGGLVTVLSTVFKIR
jgi:hypothetical protein